MCGHAAAEPRGERMERQSRAAISSESTFKNGISVPVRMDLQLSDLGLCSTPDEMLKMQVNPLPACLFRQQSDFAWFNI